MKGNILLVNGPNLNLLGEREVDKYGRVSLQDIISMVREEAGKYGLGVIDFQSNIEGEIVSFIQQKADESDALIINPGAYTHTSIAIRDAILAKKILTIEVHLTNIYNREEFRHRSYIADISYGRIVGFGHYGYLLALNALVNFILKDGK